MQSPQPPLPMQAPLPPLPAPLPVFREAIAAAVDVLSAARIAHESQRHLELMFAIVCTMGLVCVDNALTLVSARPAGQKLPLPRHASVT